MLFRSPILRIIDKEALFTEETLKLAEWIASLYFCSTGEALSVLLPLGRRESKEETIPFEDMDISDHAVSPSPEQTKAISAVLSADRGAWYLYGKTGTGKTEVFLQCAEATLAEGRSVLYLVPEIALTHQVIDSITRRFGACCAVLHSGLTPSQRLKEWRRIQRGEALVVVGARSAVFAPMKKLGLIILDEEHESSYKSGSNPHYHARQVALHRAAEEGARMVMGSATPSVEAWHLMEKGSIPRLVLTQRLAGGEMPSIEIIDMKKEDSILSRTLIEAILEEHSRGGQSILFLNRRGFSYHWHCKTCGFVLKCRHCDVPLTFHKSKNRLICHYCGYQESPPEACPDCASFDIGYTGFGTERIEETIQALLPGLSVARLDTDAAVQKGHVQKTLELFTKGKIDVLLGTQMVAKGLNVPGVRLVGIVMADTGLSLPDFRAQERTFALITQVAGRAGRFIKGGRVILQTWRPKYFVIQNAAAGDLEAFYSRELSLRKEQFFPPFSRVIRVVVRSKNDEKAKAAVRELAEMLESPAAARAQPGSEHNRPADTRAGSPANAAAAPLWEMLGPVECPLHRITGYYRYHLILRAVDLKTIHRKAREIRLLVRKTAGVDIDIDVDPQNFL